MGGAFFVAKSCEDLGGVRSNRANDGSSRLRRQKTLTLSGGGFCLSGNRRVRIWEELASASDGSSRLRQREEPRISSGLFQTHRDHLAVLTGEYRFTNF